MNNARRAATAFAVMSVNAHHWTLFTRRTKRDRELSQQTVLLINTVYDLRLRPIARLTYNMQYHLFIVCGWHTNTKELIGEHVRSDIYALALPTTTVYRCWCSRTFIYYDFLSSLFSYLCASLSLSLSLLLFNFSRHIRRTTVLHLMGLSLQFNQIVLCFDVQILWILNEK